VSLALFIICGLALIATAVSDISSYRLPNTLTLVVASTAFIQALLVGSYSSLGWKGALVALGLGFIFSLGGIIGAGDVKLIAACLLWFPGQVGVDFFLVTSLLGLLMALTALLWGAVRRKKITRLPYGLAISCAALLGLTRRCFDHFS
jgi:prepilin peptidase CpaA